MESQLHILTLVEKEKSFLPKVTLQIGLKDFLWLEFKHTILWMYVISDLSSEEIAGMFYKKALQKTNQKELKIGKVIKRIGYQLYVKWKSHDNYFNSWIDTQDIVI